MKKAVNPSAMAIFTEKNSSVLDRVKVEDMLQFIPKNKAIPSELRAISESDCRKIINAYHNKKYTDAIYRDDKANLYAIKAWHLDLVPYNAMMDILMHVALIQTFDPNCELKSGQPVKLDEQWQVIEHQSETMFSIFVKKKASNWQDELGNFVEDLDDRVKKIISRIIATPKAYCYKFTLTEPLKEGSPAYRARGYIKTFADTVFTDSELESGNAYYPNFTLFRIILEELNPELAKGLTLIPVFGRVSEASLIKMHEKLEHPLNIYSNFVKNNFIAEGELATPFCAFVHDLVYHVTDFAISDFCHFKFINQEIVPVIKDQIFDPKRKNTLHVKRLKAILADFSWQSTSCNKSQLSNRDEYFIAYVENLLSNLQEMDESLVTAVGQKLQPELLASYDIKIDFSSGLEKFDLPQLSNLKV